MAEKQWCPGCSREVEGVCHHFNCAIGPNGLDAQSRSSAATEQTLPCPFCGSETLIGDTGTCWVRCASVDCGAEGPLRDNETDAITAWNAGITNVAQAVSDPVGLEDAIRTAETMLSEHIEEFHDFDYQPHEVPLELQQLRNIQHHLLGTLVEIAEAKEAPPVKSCSAATDYVLMPREATRAMTMAACDRLPSCEHVFGHAGEMLRSAYEQMVKVAAVETSANTSEVPTDALINLVNYQEQCDEDGVMVKVSRQALAEVLLYVQLVRPGLNGGPQAAAHPDVEARIAVLSDALKSISNNTCCDNCQEAARVARSALCAYVGLSRTVDGGKQ
jgi:hypothetical protein